MSNITKWTNMCTGFFAFSCEAVDPQGNILEISTLYCWILKLNLFVEILLILPFIPLLKLYYQYYGKQWFRSRQRVIYLCLLTLFTSNLSFSVFNVLALYQISFFMSQILFWHVLGYFIIKVEKLASGPIVVSLKVLYWIFLLLFIGYLGAVLIAPLSQDTVFCPGIIDTEFWVYKCVLVAGLVILDVYAGILLRILLSRESESLLDPRDISQRRMDFIKLWTLLIVVSISELCHLIVSILYYSNGLDANQCNIIGGDETGTFDAILALIYRGIIVYAPVLALLWMIWISDKDIQQHFNESYAEEVFNTDSRYAARLSFKRRSQAHTQSNILLSVANIPPPILEDSEDDR